MASPNLYRCQPPITVTVILHPWRLWHHPQEAQERVGGSCNDLGHLLPCMGPLTPPQWVQLAVAYDFPFVSQMKLSLMFVPLLFTNKCFIWITSTSLIAPTNFKAWTHQYVYTKEWMVIIYELHTTVEDPRVGWTRGTKICLCKSFIYSNIYCCVKTSRWLPGCSQ